MYSPYAAMGNAPSMMIDPDGLLYYNSYPSPLVDGGMSPEAKEMYARWDAQLFGVTMGDLASQGGGNGGGGGGGGISSMFGNWSGGASGRMEDAFMSWTSQSLSILYDNSTEVYYASNDNTPTVLQTAIIKGKREPKTRFGKVFSKALDVFQSVLDVVGLVPGLGEFADGINAVIYLARGDKVNAALSFAAMIPVGGQAATVAKIVNRSKAVIQKHHVIPKAMYKQFPELKSMGIKRDGGINLKKLPTPFHGNHPAYNTRVKEKLQEMKDAGQLTPENINQFQNELRQEINDVYFEGWERLNDFYKAKGYKR